MDGLILAPSDFVALLNQTLELVYPVVTIEGELANLRISKNKWVYFALKDDISTVSFFGNVFQLPGPLEDGMMVRVVGSPRLHPRFGFSVNMHSIVPAGEGAIKKAADLLKAKLQAEGLFDDSRKRLLPDQPARIGLITAANSAAYADFIKILNEHWGGVEIWLADTYVQGEKAAPQLVAAIEHFNQSKELVELIVMTRGGGSAEDLAAFSDERVVRAVAASRIPTVVAVGHESDISLAELAADLRASTPSNAAAAIVPNRQNLLASLAREKLHMARLLGEQHAHKLRATSSARKYLLQAMEATLKHQLQQLSESRNIAKLLDPKGALKRGYAIVTKDKQFIKSLKQITPGDLLSIQISDGKISAAVKGTGK